MGLIAVYRYNIVCCCIYIGLSTTLLLWCLQCVSNAWAEREGMRIPTWRHSMRMSAWTPCSGLTCIINRKFITKENNYRLTVRFCSGRWFQLVELHSIIAMLMHSIIAMLMHSIIAMPMHSIIMSRQIVLWSVINYHLPYGSRERREVIHA